MVIGSLDIVTFQKLFSSLIAHPEADIFFAIRLRNSTASFPKTARRLDDERHLLGHVGLTKVYTSSLSYQLSPRNNFIKLEEYGNSGEGKEIIPRITHLELSCNNNG